MDEISNFLQNIEEICKIIDKSKIELLIQELIELKKRKGRLFILGVGGSSANASHAVNDFRKICGIETYSPTDNISELTARINDDGWGTVFVEWLKISKLSKDDVIFILSVGGGDLEKKISENLVEAVDYAIKIKCKILGIIGRDGGYTFKKSDFCILIPTINQNYITPLTESFQSIILHLIISNSNLKEKITKWEQYKKI